MGQNWTLTNNTTAQIKVCLDSPKCDKVKRVLLFGINGSGKPLIEHMKKTEFDDMDDIIHTMYEFGPFMIKQFTSNDISEYCEFSDNQRPAVEDQILLNGYCRKYNVPNDILKLIQIIYQIPIIKSYCFKDRNTIFDLFDISMDSNDESDDWKYCLDELVSNTLNIVYFVNLSHFNEINESNGENKLSETLKLLRRIANNISIKQWTKMVIIFTHQNEFDDKVTTQNIPITVCSDFKKYTGPDRDCLGSKVFIEKVVEYMVNSIIQNVTFTTHNMDKYFSNDALKLHRVWELIASDVCLSHR